MGSHVLLSLAVESSVNSKPEQKVDSLPLPGINPATPTNRFDHTVKNHPK
jgi:hypothetical protein